MGLRMNTATLRCPVTGGVYTAVINDPANPLYIKNISAEENYIFNVTVTDDSAVFSQVLQDSTKSFTISHRASGKFEFSFDPTLTTFQTVKCGGSFHIDGVSLTGKTIYFRSTKAGVVEINTWA